MNNVNNIMNVIIYFDCYVVVSQPVVFCIHCSRHCILHDECSIQESIGCGPIKVQRKVGLANALLDFTAFDLFVTLTMKFVLEIRLASSAR